MITFDDVKDRFLIKSEKNAVNDNIAVDNKRLTILYNEAQNKFLTLHLQNRGSDDIRYIQNFLVLDKKITAPKKQKDKYSFDLPKDYFDLADVRAKAEKEKCVDFIFLFEIKTENLTEVLTDEFQQPSFEWREAPYTINSNQLSIYVDDFQISEVLLNYYRYPSQAGVLNEQDPESDFTPNFKVEWDDKSLDDIISIMVSNLDINQNNPRFQLQTIRAQK